MSLGGGPNTEGSNAGGIFVQFNQDCTSLVAGSTSGYHLFSLTADDGVEEIYASRSGQETCLVDRLFSSSLVAVVTVSAPRKLIVCHYKKGTEICNYSYSNTILAVKLNRSRLIVCLEESLHIHNIRDMKVLHTIRDTPPNPRGLCALSPCVDHCYVAYPGSSAVGEVQIFDAVHLNAKCAISAHESPVAALAWSMCGRRLATASERGTVIRVFSVPERVKLYELRRGVKRCVSIACLSFSACGTYLAATSNTETVHVFKLQEGAEAGGAGSGAGGAAGGAGGGGGAGGAGGSAGGAGGGGGGGETGEGGGWMGWLSAAVSAGAGYLPAHVAHVADVLAQGRAFAAARLPRTGHRAVAAITNHKMQCIDYKHVCMCCVCVVWLVRRACWWRRRRACCTCTRWTRPRAGTARCSARTACSTRRRHPPPPPPTPTRDSRPTPTVTRARCEDETPRGCQSRSARASWAPPWSRRHRADPSTCATRDTSHPCDNSPPPPTPPAPPTTTPRSNHATLTATCHVSRRLTHTHTHTKQYRYRDQHRLQFKFNLASVEIQNILLCNVGFELS